MVQTDNQSAARIVSVGSSKPHLQAVAFNLYQLCLANQIVISAQWIPRSLNEQADALNRYVDSDDWSINPSVFRWLQAKWGPYMINRFASLYNTELARFNSKYASPGCSGVDAFTQNWINENNRLCPPVSLIVASV